MPRERILVIDDSPTILKLVQLVLTKADYQVATAAGGTAGLEQARQEAPDLVLLDYLMPDQDGQAVCTALAADAALAAVPVVLMSVKGQEVEARFRHMSNVVDAIGKPFAPDALLTVVGHSLKKRAAKDAAPEASAADIGSLSLVPANEPVPEAAEMALIAAAALSGNMAAVSIADVLGLLKDEAQTGVLSIAREDARLQISLREGSVDFATAEGVPEDFLLGRFLVRAGAIGKEDLADVLEARSRMVLVPLGLLGADLVGRGLVTTAGLRKAVSLQTAALVFESLRWGAGRFWFEAGADVLPAAARDAALGLSIDALLMEGFRRVDEWRLIEREVGDFDQVFVRDEDKVAALGRGKLTREELTVLEIVNGKNSVRDIVHLSQLGSFEATRMLYRLLRTKLVRRRVTPVAA
jgi:CheY-like chemotaxis protein